MLEALEEGVESFESVLSELEAPTSSSKSEPSVVISHKIKPGSKAALKDCLCFQGSDGSITISLGRAVALESVQVMHLQQAEGHKAYRGSAPATSQNAKPLRIYSTLNGSRSFVAVAQCAGRHRTDCLA